MLLGPTSAAMAGVDDPALLKFSLPSGDQYDDFEALGLDMGDGVDKLADGRVIVQAWVTDEQLAWVRAHGFENVGVVHDRFNIDRIRAEREQSIADERRGQARADGQQGRQGGPERGAGHGAGAARRLHGEQRQGRYISIEANTTDAQVTCTQPDRGHWLLVHRPAARGLLV